jgi:hypothetical protein
MIQAPVFINVSELILIATLEFPEIALSQANKYIAFAFFGEKLIKFFQFFTSCFSHNCICKFVSRSHACKRMTCWQGKTKIEVTKEEEM